MGIQDFGTMDPNASLKQVIGELANLMDTLNFLLNGNLDVKNIRADSLTARVIKAGTITATEIAAGTITADKMDVTELSAISANLGHIVAGLIEAVSIYGSYIATANGTYPRVEMSSSGNLLGAFLDATHSLSIEPNIGGAPGIGFKDPSGLTGRIYGNSGLGMIALVDNVELTSLSGRIDITAPNGLWVNGVKIAP